ncbi:MAG: hypothetical protein LBL07_11750 [Tannerella sp.]|jgi:hypothetical protein|nr:hypothetical protein [Tannerella sp.]
MKRLIRYILLMGCFYACTGNAVTAQEAHGDSIEQYFMEQRYAFPQEKIYLHNDKPCYIAGEEIWFRVYLTDFASHIPDTASRYVYVELINPLDSVVARVKIRHENGVYRGHLSLPEEIAEGNYTLRCYTRFMEGIGEEYFFRRRITVGGVLSSLYHTAASFSGADGRTPEISLSFERISDGKPFTPEEVRIGNPSSGKVEKLKPEKDGTVRYRIARKSETGNSVLRMEYETDNKTHVQFIPLPVFAEDYDVAFFPEGGCLPEGCRARVAFKALHTDGTGGKVTGEVFSAAHPETPLVTFESNELGMGAFFMEARDSCYAVCRNEAGEEKRFALPAPDKNRLSLRCVWSGELLTVAVVGPAGMTSLPEGLRLIAHCRGTLLYNREWDAGSIFAQFRKDLFPSGITHFLLTDRDLNPVSERLVFNMNGADLADVLFTTDKPVYRSRERIRASISLADGRGYPLTGSFSVSVTDDGDTGPDSTVNILSAMLLTSELKGYIESPAWYLKEGNLSQLDNLMLTQGWSRYPVTEVLKGHIEPARGTLEAGSEITGHIINGLFLQNRGKGYSVMLTVNDPPILKTAVADEDGRFRFTGIELCDSSVFRLMAVSPKGSGFRCDLTVDRDTFPDIRCRLPQTGIGKPVREIYMQKAERKHTREDGIRTIFLPDVTVTGRRRKGKSPISVGTGLGGVRIITLNEIKRKENSATTMYAYLQSVGGLNVTPEYTEWLGEGAPLFIVDEVETDDFLFIYNIRMNLIEEMEIVRPRNHVKGHSTAFERGAILITSKARDGAYPQRDGYNKKVVIPLGYQQAKEFYAPRYETEEQRMAVAEDLRTTVYWNPSVQTDHEGKAALDFYAADAATTYSVIIEGITDNGEFIREEDKIRIHE